MEGFFYFFLLTWLYGGICYAANKTIHEELGKSHIDPDVRIYVTQGAVFACITLFFMYYVAD